MSVVGDVRDNRLEHCARRPGGEPGIPVGVLAFSCHRLSAQQRPGVLGNEADEPDRLGRGERRRDATDDFHGAPLGAAEPDKVVEKGRLPSPIPPHYRHDLTLIELEADVRQRRDRPVGGGEALHLRHAVTPRRRAVQSSSVLEAAPELPARADGHRGPKAEGATIRLHAGGGRQVAPTRQSRRRRRRVAADRTGCTTDLDYHVCELHDALEAVLGDEDGRALVVDEARERSQYLLRRDGIEGRRRLVEHKSSWRGGEGCADGNASALAARQCADRARRSACRFKVSSTSSTRRRIVAGSTPRFSIA